MSARTIEPPTSAAARPPRQVAVIDIGTSSVRMAVAEINASGQVRQLETLAQAVNLGKDAFIRGAISKATIEDCVRVLKSYRRILKEYQIENPAQVRVVATSAVREATNRLAFVDRIYIATGFQVEPLDEAEVIRITFLGVQPFLLSDPALASRRGPWSPKSAAAAPSCCWSRAATSVYSHTYRLGSLRLRETLEALRAPTLKVRNIMETHIHRTVAEIAEHVSRDGPIELIAMGGDVRFAVRQLQPEWDGHSLARLPLKGLEDFTNKILGQSEDKLVRKYRLSYPEAETLGPALLAYVLLAKELQLTSVLVTQRQPPRRPAEGNGRQRRLVSKEFSKQIIRSAMDLGRKFDFDEPHAVHVAQLCSTLFQQLREEHQLPPRYEVDPARGGAAARDRPVRQQPQLPQALAVSDSQQRAVRPGQEGPAAGGAGGPLSPPGLAAADARRLRHARPRRAGGRGQDGRDPARSPTPWTNRAASGSTKCNVEREGDRLVISIPLVEDLSLEKLALKQSGAPVRRDLRHAGAAADGAGVGWVKLAAVSWPGRHVPRAPTHRDRGPAPRGSASRSSLDPPYAAKPVCVH